MSAPERQLPPIIEIGVVAMALCIAGVIYLVSYAPNTPSLGPAIGLVVAAAVVVLANIAVLARTPNFNWPLFWKVGWWTLVGLSAACFLATLLNPYHVRLYSVILE